MGTPPEPTVDDIVKLANEIGTIAWAFAAVFILSGIIVFGAMLLRASRYRWPVPIIAPLAMLTLVFGLAGMAVQELIPLAGAGLGALAGVLTAQLGRKPDDDNDEDDPPTPLS